MGAISKVCITNMDNYPMLDVFLMKFQRLKQDYRFRARNITLILLIGLILSNKLLLCLLGLPNTAWPWSFIDVIRQGFVIPMLIAFMVVYVPLSACCLWWAGGIKRAIAQQMLVYWGFFLVLSVLGLTFFIYWEEMNLQPYPWLIVSLFLKLPGKSTNHLLLCL
ncbi:MAG: hypothetical protein RLZZ225_204, partial [Pseudomonadota bacterium]